MDDFECLILAGGKSTRMGSPKHLLPISDGTPLYRQLAFILKAAFPSLSKCYISLAKDSVRDDAIRRGNLTIETSSGPVQLPLCSIFDETTQDIGPVAGLIAAHHHNPIARWLVLACDFPLLQVETLRQLVDNYEDPVTCFKNSSGFVEPFLAIWSPKAFQVLERNVAQSVLGPSRTIKDLNGNGIAPRQEWWIKNVNTSVEWNFAKMHMDCISQASSVLE